MNYSWSGFNDRPAEVNCAGFTVGTRPTPVVLGKVFPRGLTLQTMSVAFWTVPSTSFALALPGRGAPRIVPES